MEDLPRDTLLNHVFSRLTYKERWALGAACRRLRTLCDQSFQGLALDVPFGYRVRFSGTLAGLQPSRAPAALRDMLSRGAGLREAQHSLYGCASAEVQLFPLLTESPAYTAHLRRLSLDPNDMSEEALACLPLLAGCANLEDVQIYADRCEQDGPIPLRPTQVSFLSKLPRLKKLFFMVPTNFSSADIAATIPAATLESLSMSWIGARSLNGWLDLLPDLPMLNDFSLDTFFCLTDTANMPWAKFSALRQLDVRHVAIDPGCCREPIHLPLLASLHWTEIDDCTSPLCDCMVRRACTTAHLSAFVKCLDEDSRATLQALTLKVHGIHTDDLLADLDAVSQLGSLQQLDLDLNPYVIDLSGDFGQLCQYLNHRKLPNLARLTLEAASPGRESDVFMTLANLPALESFTIKGIQELSPTEARSSAGFLLRALAHPLRPAELPLRVWVTQKKDADGIAAAAAEDSPATVQGLMFKYHVPVPEPYGFDWTKVKKEWEEGLERDME